MAHLSETNTKLLHSLMEREKLEEKLVQSEKMAAIGHFSAGIAHELMAPLQGIFSLAQRICRRLDMIVASGEIPWVRPDGKSQVTVE